MSMKHSSRGPVLALHLLLQILSSSSQLFSVNEEVPLGTSVGFIVGMGHQQTVNYYLEPRDSLFRFHDSKQTLVITNSTIDREELCAYQEKCIRTYDVMTHSMDHRPFVLTRITILINDINDHSPMFPIQNDQPFVVRISESVSPGYTRQKLPSAEDLDLGSNGNITYSFLTPRTTPSALTKFALGKYVIDDVTHMLLLVVSEKLDRETEDEYNLTIIAEDGGSPSRSSILEVKVQITDHNDNAPQFDRSNYTVYVDEDLTPGSEIISLSATDVDRGENARLKFAWSDETSRNFGGLFSIDSASGLVRLKSFLDREEKEIFHLMAIAADSGKVSLSSHTLVTVYVRDVNDNTPSIVLNSMNGQSTDLLEILENSPQGTPFGRLFVYDKDQGINGRTSCSLEPPSSFVLSHPRRNRQGQRELVEFDLLTGVVLDREVSSRHDAVVACVDGGKPQLQSTKVVRINVLDENDNSPVFEKNVYRVEIEENTEVGTMIFQLKANDIDEGNNSVITYQLEPQQTKWQNMLKIDENGEITITGDIDCEENSQMMFIVRAMNPGEPIRIGEAGFELTVKDKDEHSPLFERTSYEFSMHARVPENFIIGQVRGFDNDCSTRFGRVIYRLEDTFRENIENFIYVDKNSGEIHSRVPLDVNKILKFSVFPGNPSGRWFPESRAEIIVKISIDEQTKHLVGTPVFHFPNATNNSVTLLLGNENGTAVCQLQVANSSFEKAGKLMRSGNRNIFKFAILSGNEGGLLSIDEFTGWIRTTTVLNSAMQLTLNVSAYNSLNMNECTTSTLVININKHEAVSSDQSFISATILDHSVLIAVLLASSAFLVVFCVSVFVIRCHLHKRKRRPRRYNCRLETVKAASNCSLNRGNYLNPEISATSTSKDEQNSIATSTLQKFNNRFVSFNVDDDFPCRGTDSRVSCPFRDNCSLHKPFVPGDFDEMSYLNERDLYNLPSFSTQTTSLYSTQKSLPDENQFKSFKPLRASPTDRPPSSSSGLRQLSPASFFPITCSGHLTSSLSAFNYINNCGSKDAFEHVRSPSSINCEHRQAESQI